MSSTENDTSIVAVFTAGDKDGFAKAYDQHYLLIYYIARKYTGDPAVAEDLAADCFVKLWQHAEKGNEIRNVKSFLCAAVRNASIDYIKRSKVYEHKKNELQYLIEQDGADVFSLSEIKADVMNYVYEEIEKLPPQCRQIFKLSYIDGLKTKEVASRLQIAEQSVSNQKTKALNLLRIALKDKEWMLMAFLVFVKNS